ncbi:alpha/beta hydrolase fold domain-containing protein [Candidatus Berkiella aquae]|uniref:Alpha/beta hydrolase n=1 Tax=Candidatus Berkiella aquae TaxID=295108 RepID=A0A0Q9YV39_9GAMM|nr:alpha/beta hydrolase [Candidatus Berkiella aquae]MCS5712226.1 alpha/beta hydrolase [Candidatus Berkiella aquae]
MAIDNSFIEFLKTCAQQPDLSEFTPVQNRERFKANTNVVYSEALARIKTEDKEIKANDHAIPIRHYYLSEKKAPCLIWFHGGGFVMGSIAGYDLICRKIANAANISVISVDYRLAPEHKFPAAIEDAYMVVHEVIQNAELFNVDKNNIYVGGASVGATLATVTCLIMRDQGHTGTIKHQLLMMPVINDDFSTHSYQLYGENYFLTKKSMQYFMNHYINNESDLLNPYCLPGKAKNLQSLPPAMIVTAECDPLRDAGEQYATRLKNEGNQVDYYNYPGLFHGFTSMIPSNAFAEKSFDKIITDFARVIIK